MLPVPSKAGATAGRAGAAHVLWPPVTPADAGSDLQNVDAALGFGAVGIGASTHPNTGRLALLHGAHESSEDDVEVSLDIQGTIGRAWVAAVNRVGSLSLAWQSEAAVAQDELSRDMEAMLVFDASRRRLGAPERPRRASHTNAGLRARSATNNSGGSSHRTVRSDDWAVKQRPRPRPRPRQRGRQQAPGHTLAQPPSLGMRLGRRDSSQLPAGVRSRRSASLPPLQITANAFPRLVQASPGAASEAASRGRLADEAISLTVLEEQVSDMFVELGAHSPYAVSTQSASTCPGGMAPRSERPAPNTPQKGILEGQVVLVDDDDDDSSYSDEPAPTARGTAAPTTFVHPPDRHPRCPGLCLWCRTTAYAPDNQAVGCVGVEAVLERVELADSYIQRVGHHASVIDALLADLRAQSCVLVDTLAASQAQASLIRQAIAGADGPEATTSMAAQAGSCEQTMRSLYKRSRALRAHATRCQGLDVQRPQKPGRPGDRSPKDDTLHSGGAAAIDCEAPGEKGRPPRTAAPPPKSRRVRTANAHMKDIDRQWIKLRGMLDAAASNNTSTGGGLESDVVISGLKVVHRTLKTVIEYLTTASGDALLAE